jgi:hypothetical protein
MLPVLTATRTEHFASLLRPVLPDMPDSLLQALKSLSIYLPIEYAGDGAMRIKINSACAISAQAYNFIRAVPLNSDIPAVYRIPLSYVSRFHVSGHADIILPPCSNSALPHPDFQSPGLGISRSSLQTMPSLETCNLHLPAIADEDLDRHLRLNGEPPSPDYVIAYGTARRNLRACLSLYFETREACFRGHHRATENPFIHSWPAFDSTPRTPRPSEPSPATSPEPLSPLAQVSALFDLLNWTAPPTSTKRRFGLLGYGPTPEHMMADATMLAKQFIARQTMDDELFRKIRTTASRDFREGDICVVNGNSIGQYRIHNSTGRRYVRLNEGHVIHLP